MRDNLARQGFENFQSSCSTGSYRPSSRHDMVAHDRVGTFSRQETLLWDWSRCLSLSGASGTGRANRIWSRTEPACQNLCHVNSAYGTDVFTRPSYLAVYGHYIIVYRVQTLRLHPCRRLGNGRIEKRQTLMGL